MKRERERERENQMFETHKELPSEIGLPLVRDPLSLSHTPTNTPTHTHSLSLCTIWYSTPIKKYWSFYILKLLIEQKVLHDFVLLWSNYNNLEAGGLSWCISPKWSIFCLCLYTHNMKNMSYNLFSIIFLLHSINLYFVIKFVF